MENRQGPLCPLCGNANVRKLFAAQPPLSRFSLIRCSGCGLGYTFPFPEDGSVSDGLFESYYGTGPNKFGPLMQGVRTLLMRMRAKRYLRLIPNSVTRPRILDFGCAEGRLLQAFLDYGCECWGVEHHSYPSDRFIAPERITYLKSKPEASELPDLFFHLIFLWHTLEHMEDPDAIIGWVSRLLAPGGVIVMAVPNISSMEARAFRAHWFHVDIPWHRYHFDAGSLEYLLKKHGLKMPQIRTFCLEQGPYGLVQSILNAMGFPRNELYDFLKGRRKGVRFLHVITQLFLAGLLLGPAILAGLLTSLEKKGPVVKVMIRKEEG